MKLKGGKPNKKGELLQAEKKKDDFEER